MSYIISVIANLFRRKKFSDEELVETNLRRCLSLLDLTALGVGSTLGAGVYVVAGQVARSTAGPSVILSFFVSALASVFAGLCYAEFGARVPRTGSAYVYSYVSVGELMAFVIGWNMQLEYVIGTASVAKAWSDYVDALSGNAMSKWLLSVVPMNACLSILDSKVCLGRYFDVLAFLVVIALTLVLCKGIRESTILNNFITALNLIVIAFVCLVGMFRYDLSNWALSRNDSRSANVSDKDLGAGGFFPFGVNGMLSGAATCFYAFVGFDIIATTGEEVQNPQRAIPLAIILCLVICFVGYAGVSATVTLICPYFLLDKNTPLVSAFQYVHFDWAYYIISGGAICALTASLLGGIVPMPRIIYAMASDGLIFRFLGTINSKFQTPLIATGVSGFLAGVMAALFDLESLVEMMSIGTLLAYTLVAISVLLLRYQVEEQQSPNSLSAAPGDAREQHQVAADVTSPLLSEPRAGADAGLVSNEHLPERGGEASPSSESELIELPPLSQLVRLACVPNASRHLRGPTAASDLLTKLIISSFLLFALLFGVMLVFFNLTSIPVIIITVVIGLVLVLHLYVLWIQPESLKRVAFKVPCVPLIPSLSAFVNLYLMLKLSIPTWIRFAIWMVLGMSIYIFYGYWNSSERLKRLHPRGATSSRATGSFSSVSTRSHEGRHYERLPNDTE